MTRRIDLAGAIGLRLSVATFESTETARRACVRLSHLEGPVACHYGRHVVSVLPAADLRVALGAYLRGAIIREGGR